MNHIQIRIDVVGENQQEKIISNLIELGYEGFEQNENELLAYIEEAKFNNAELTNFLAENNLSFSKQIIPQQNWNEVWESNFDPVIVDNFVGIRAHFHDVIKNVKHEIVITPKMSFGTGHHATTFMVMQLMRDVDFKNKTVFDFGSGTGILAILAEKLGAAELLAFDYDDWCIENALENVQQNNCSKIKIAKADNAIVEKQFDIVIANINKNIIQDNFEHLNNAIILNGTIILSGLLIEDESDILQLASQHNWIHKTTTTKGAWIAIKFVKN